MTREPTQADLIIEGALEIAKAIYDDKPGDRSTDAGILRTVADWLDVLDDKTDALLEQANRDHRVARTVQADLRRIADGLPS